MKHIIFLFLITTILYINADDNPSRNIQAFLQQQRNEQNNQNEKLKISHYNQQSKFNKNNTRAQMQQGNRKIAKFTGRRSHPR